MVIYGGGEREREKGDRGRCQKVEPVVCVGRGERREGGRKSVPEKEKRGYLSTALIGTVEISRSWLKELVCCKKNLFLLSEML